MAFEGPRICVSLPAGGDLSAAQYRFVTLANSSGVAVINRSTQGDRLVGVLQDKPAAAGRAGEVCIFGITKVVAGAGITAGQAVSADSLGRAVAVASTVDFEAGICLETVSNAGEMATILLTQHGLQ